MSGETFFTELLSSLGANKSGAIIEIMTYFGDSFGSNVRLDYGTGHEMNFLLILYCLGVLEYYTQEDLECLCRNVFYKYMKLMRKIQLTYRLEPAGSRGAWGLDDYHFVPFMFGGAELINHSVVKDPSCIHNESFLEEYSEEYIYLGIICSN